MVAAEKETSAKPQGPLIIAISINQQKVRVYDANGFFAESPVSTGTKSHPTPMGVFSIIQKHKMHHSNIYSGAPMPFMQRITWSGVAMHAGALPGYPASHGCIRLPMAFAAKMWNWTRMGARVVVTPGEITPANFSHPLLVAQKVVPQPAIADAAEGGSAGGEIRQGRGRRFDDQARGFRDEPGTAIDRRARQPRSDAAARTNPHRRCQRSHAGDQCRGHDVRRLALREQDAGVQRSRCNERSSEARGRKFRIREIGSRGGAGQERGRRVDTVAEGSEIKCRPRSNRLRPSPTARRPKQPSQPKAKPVSQVRSDPGRGAKSDEVKTGTLKADAPKARQSRSAESRRETVGARQGDRRRACRCARREKGSVAPAGRRESAAAKPEPKRAGQIAVFVSRKDGKLYVRQNFMPLFDVPVTIAPSDRMLGTHVFTAEVDKNDPNLLRWSVVSLPVTARNAAAQGRRRARLAPAQGRRRSPRRGQAGTGAEQPGRSAGPHHGATGSDGAHRRGADDGWFDRGVRSRHQHGRNRRRHRLHRSAALARNNGLLSGAGSPARLCFALMNCARGRP